MKQEYMSLILVFLSGWSFQLVLKDEQPDSDYQEDVPETHRDTHLETNWNDPDVNRGNYEDADWHPSTSMQETNPDLVTHSGDTSAVTNHILNQTGSRSPGRCGEYSSHLTSGGQCRLIATLPSVGTTEKRCPDMFRCTDDISFWVHENQNRKEQLEELRETMSELQEELRNHQHRVKVLEMRNENSITVNTTFIKRLSLLELRHSEADTLLHVHSALLHELQAQLRNLTSSMHHTDCSISIIRTAPPLGMRNTRPPDGRYFSFCPSDCASLHHNGVRHSGVYTIIMFPGTIKQVYCDMDTDGGGWTVFQRRYDGSVSFNRGWLDYRDGFGEARGEHWLGNHHIHLLTNQGHYSLRIDLQDWNHVHKHALYQSFRIDNEENEYRLHVSGFSGTMEDSFAWYHDQRGFSTPDTGNICAEISHAGWWFHQCFYANLNGVYYKGGRYSLKTHNLLGPDGIVWFSWKDSDFYSLKSVTMMIRPRNFRPRPSP